VSKPSSFSPHTHDQPLDLSAIMLTAFLSAIWGGAFVAIKFNLFDMPPLGAAALRFGITAVVLLAWARYQAVALRYGWAEVKLLVILGLLFCYGNMAVYIGTALTTSGRSAVFFSVQPIFIALLAPFFLPGDRLTARKLGGLGLAFVGIVVLFSAKLGGGLTDAVIGDAIVLSSAVATPGFARVLADVDILAYPGCTVLELRSRSGLYSLDPGDCVYCLSQRDFCRLWFCSLRLAHSA